MLVRMAKTRLAGVALAIGDGANDVSMIQASNVGVGIMGKEGTQAALAADFVIHRFRHLTRLLFVHGRFSFLRTSTLCLISLYKNMVFMMPIAYFGFYSVYTAQPMFDPNMMSAFNILFAAAFPFCVGIFEQDIREDTAMNHPEAYRYFKLDTVFDLKAFAMWMFTAFWQSCVVFFTIYLVSAENGDLWNSSGQTGGLWAWGTEMLTAVVLTACLKMMAESKHWNWFYYFSTALGISLYFGALTVMSNSLSYDPDLWNVMSSFVCFWLLFFLLFFYQFEHGREKAATLSVILKEAEEFGYLTNDGEHKKTKQVVEAYLTKY
ncbi:transmembrane protein [Reticulomyxa filosa]|uniref:Transmembrane protein n=1 Tax=Reticulomyxa filosa TaxID=46433 RepID=X6MS53_RETFI|nr:transmembrane protein [Reticulomyxa filosa]|eukprot:ETO15895.1 transmembrane protein [Reticulomyxa filosa]